MSGDLGVLAAVLGASVLGSLHCVGMCGGFVAAACGSAGPSGKRELGPMWTYQGARLLAYASLGGLAGALGAGLDHGAAFVGLSRLAGPLMGVTLIAMAIVQLGLGRRTPTRSEPLVSLGGHAQPTRLERLRLRLTRFAARRGLAAGAAAGLLSALLPCGWLWAYVAVAAATGRAGFGAAVMAAFWLGSVPALLGVGLLADTLRHRLGPHANKLVAALMLGLGVFALFGKLSLGVALDPGSTSPAEPRDDSSQTEPAATPDPASLPSDAPCH